jgi:hypothetical protein
MDDLNEYNQSIDQTRSIKYGFEETRKLQKGLSGKNSFLDKIYQAVSGVFSKKETAMLTTSLRAVSSSSVLLEEETELFDDIDYALFDAKDGFSGDASELNALLDNFFEEKVVPEIQKNWEKIKQEALYPIDSLEEETKRAREIFKHAATASFPFIILGNGEIWQDEHLKGNVGILAAEPDAQVVSKLKRRLSDVYTPSQGMLPPMLKESVLTESVAQEKFFKKGSILCDEKWSILRNDMIILGGILGGKEFHLALPPGKLPTQENLWDEKSNRLRVFGREIAILSQAGYVLHSLPNKQGLVFTRGEETHIKNLQEIREFVASVSSKEQILQIFSSLIK